MSDADDRERWQSISAILDAVFDVPPSERSACLDRCCTGRPGLRADIEALLAASAASETFLDRPAAEHAAPLVASLAIDRQRQSTASLPGAHVGAYRLVRELGEGGMGLVWLGERTDGQFQHQVAIKIIKHGIRSQDALRRFLHERQILARLQHPGIARLLDGGVTEWGTPYFVMERVDGRPVTAYCRARRLDVDECLHVFLQICDAVQYAHRNLIVHRDLKPSNILVDADGRAKLLDFGIAKLLGDVEGAGAAAATIERMLTPDYAAPEQVRGESASTSTDVYALGVILYELLTGERPYRVESAAVSDVERAILEYEPAAPSARVAAPRLRKRLRGDLDRVVLNALQKSPDRRYPSAEAFAHDVRRHLDGLPVTARGDGLGYRASKFLKRHRIGVAAAALVASTLVGSLIATTWQARRAEREANKASAVKAFLESIFAASDPARVKGTEPSLRELLDAGARRIETELRDQPDVQSEVARLIATVYQNLGDYNRAKGLLKAEIDRRRRLDGPRSPSLAGALMQFADAAYDQGRIDEAGAIYEEALGIQRGLHGLRSPEVAELLWDLAGVARTRGDLVNAERLEQDALEIYVRTKGEDSAEAASVRESLAITDIQLARFAEAAALMEPVAAWRERHLGLDHPDTLNARYNLAFVLQARASFAEAAAMAADAVARQRRVIGPRHDRLGTTLRLLARALDSLGRQGDALRAIDEAVAIHSERFGPDDGQVATDLVWKAVIEMRADRLVEADRDARAAVRLLDGGALAVRPAVSYLRTLLGTVFAGSGRLDDARTQMERAESELRAAGHNGAYLGFALDALGDLARRQQDVPRAVELGDRALSILSATLGPQHVSTAIARVHAGAAHRAAGERATAEEMIRSGLAELEKRFPPDHVDVKASRALLERALAPAPKS